MKKLFTYFMLWVSATFNNLYFQPADDVIFQSTDYYYNGSEHDTYVDYQDKYSSYVGEEAESDDGCNLRRRTVSDGLDSQPKGALGAYWIVYGEQVPDNNEQSSSQGEYVLGCASGSVLIAPTGCKIITRASASNYGTYMQLEMGSGQYIITITDMERWYCCLDRPDEQRLENGFFQHTQDAYGVKLQAGDIIGLAGPNTHISIQKCNGSVKRPCSVYEYYNG